MTIRTRDDVAGVDSADETRSRVPVLERNPRLALVAFCVVAAAAVALYLWFGQPQWFYYDEWDFLADRQLGSMDDLLRPHNEHWSTVPIVMYRGLWSIFGLHAYWPYQLMAILNHLAIAALLRCVMRRVGVAPWIATAAAGLFVLFGSGDQNILWGFQIQFAGPMTFGLVHLILVDHDGPIGRRDWIGLLAGLAALMSSGLGVAMVVVVGLFALIRRGWRAALFHTVPLAAIYTIWWLAYGRDTLPPYHSDLGLSVRFAIEGLVSAFRLLGMVPGVGVAFAVAVVAGLVLGSTRTTKREAIARLAAPVALFVGAIVFLLITGWGRAWFFGAEYADASRYVHLTAAFVLPAIAVGVDAIYRRWPGPGVVAVALLLVGIPGNVLQSERYEERHKPIELGQPDLFLTVGRLPAAREAPPDTRPFPLSGREITVQWLLESIDAGKLPCPDSPDGLVIRSAMNTLGVEQDRKPEAIDCP